MLVNRISALFGPVLSFTDVFEAPRIGAIAARIEAAQESMLAGKAGSRAPRTNSSAALSRSG